jgi:hypothetical protein
MFHSDLRGLTDFGGLPYKYIQPILRSGLVHLSERRVSRMMELVPTHPKYTKARVQGQVEGAQSGNRWREVFRARDSMV